MKTLINLSLSLIIAFNLNAQWIQAGGPEGGGINCIKRINNELWAGTPNGMYVSLNDGASWQNHPLLKDWCLDLEYFNDTLVLLYQKLEINQNQSLDYLLYSITSFDGGMNWLSPTLIETEMFAGDGRLYKTGNAIFTRGAYDYYISYDFGNSWSLYGPPFGSGMWVLFEEDNKMLISNTGGTLNYTPGGLQNFITINTSYNINSAFMIDTIIYIEAYNSGTINHSLILKSNNYGVTWDTLYYYQPQIISNGLFFINGIIYKYTYPDYIMSSDSGNTWVTKSFANNYYINPNTIVLSNGDFLNYMHPVGLVRYSHLLNNYIPSYSGFKSQYITKLASNNSILFAGTMHALYKSLDAGNTWTPISIEIGWVTDFIFKGDTIIGAQEEYMGYLVRSFDNGISWDTVLAPVGYTWSSPTSMAELNGVLYLSGNSLNYSNDWGLTWNTMPPLPTVPGNCLTNSQQKGALKNINGQLFIVTNGGHIFKFEQTIQTWTFLYCFWSTGTSNGNSLYRLGNSIVMSGRVGMFISNDQGNTWNSINISGTPFGISPRSLVEMNNVWFGTLGSFGVYFSMDQGITWQPVHSGFAPFYSRGGLALVNNILFSAGHYSSVWRRSGAFETISGNIYYDVNNNSIKDPGENGLSQVIIKTNTTNFYATSDTLGNYSLFTDAIGDTIKAIVPASYATSNPSHYIANGAAINQDFGIYIAPDIQDLSVDITNINVFRPGFETTINLNVKNSGSVNLAAQSELILDSLLQFKSSIPAPDIQNGDTLIWNISTMNFLDQINIPVIVETFFASTIGDTINCTATVLPIIGDTLPINNIATLNEIIVGSFDPNDKQCVQGEFFTPDQLAAGEELQFIIRFQNEGTYPADFVIIKDTISYYLDLSTFRVISSSHAMQWSLSGTGIASFAFYNINLPPAIIDELGSHGYVKYAVKAKESVTIGTAITNTAYIYFDFNPPIVTNTTTTLVAYPFVLTDIQIAPAIYSEKYSLKIYPNPTTDYINIELSDNINGISRLVIRDITGKILSQQNIDRKDIISVSDLAHGIYFGSVYLNDNSVLNFKFVVN
jgi:hypothetical protein